MKNVPDDMYQERISHMTLGSALIQCSTLSEKGAFCNAHFPKKGAFAALLLQSGQLKRLNGLD